MTDQTNTTTRCFTFTPRPSRLTEREQLEWDMWICTETFFDTLAEMDLCEANQLCKAHSTTE